jgi:hypothetical protein
MSVTLTGMFPKEDCDGTGLKKTFFVHGIHRYSSHHLPGIQDAPNKNGHSMKVYRMQWYSSILGGCSSDARSFLKTKPSIKLRFQAAALRVLFFVWPSKTQHASVNPLSPSKAPFTTAPLSVLETRKITLVAVLSDDSIPIFIPFPYLPPLSSSRVVLGMLTLWKPMSLAFSRKH